MSAYKIDGALLTAVADAIREKTGESAAYTPGEMPEKIAAIDTAVTPAISVSSSGLITAAAGSKSATKQLATLAAKTVTPGTADQTAAASGVYTTGAVTVKGDTNLKAENIASGVSIFGVAGSLAASSVETAVVTISQAATAVHGLSRVTQINGCFSNVEIMYISVEGRGGIQDKTVYFCDTDGDTVTGSVTLDASAQSISISPTTRLYTGRIVFINDPAAAALS